MRVRDVMTSDILDARRDEALADVARRMNERQVLAALVERGPQERSAGICTTRDVLGAIADGRDPGSTPVSETFTPEATASGPDWSLERAAEAMLEGNFRHLVVAQDGETLGVVSQRDIVRVWVRERSWRTTIQIREAMTSDFLSCEGEQSVREAAQRMAGERTGAAIVPTGKRRSPPGIITERGILAMVAAGGDPSTERVADHLTAARTYSAPDWSLKQAAEAMIKGGFEHIMVVDATGTVGIVSMRQVLRRWLD
ncbi:MAG: CBS domain-containing protein [Actinomycetota bacterium]|nr:CBS domain-containing protein [Actinomycetota bacterium]